MESACDPEKNDAILWPKISKFVYHFFKNKDYHDITNIFWARGTYKHCTKKHNFNDKHKHPMETIIYNYNTSLNTNTSVAWTPCPSLVNRGTPVRFPDHARHDMLFLFRSSSSTLPLTIMLKLGFISF